MVSTNWIRRSKKCHLVTTHPNLQAARDWINENLEPMVRWSILEGINLPSALLPGHLNKPMYTTASQSYADILKKLFSIASTTSATTTDITWPPQKRQATKLDYDSDLSEDQPHSTMNPESSTNSAITNPHANSQPMPTMTNSPTYTAELLSLKAEIDLLKATIAMAVEQFKHTIKSLTINPCQPESNAMDTNAKTTSDASNSNQIQTNVSSLIHNLKHEIATFVIETRALLQHQSLPMSQNITCPQKPESSPEPVWVFLVKLDFER